MRNLRRSDREISSEEVQQILEEGEYGVLSTVDGEGQPYGVPLNYVYSKGAVYFHCALTGHKLDNIRDNDKASFCVVGKTKVLPDKFTTDYESAVVFGVAQVVDDVERDEALLWLTEKYSPDFMEQGKGYITTKGHTTKVVKLKVTGISGKARR